MSYAEKHVVALTTDASGNATGYTGVITGKINSVVYAKTDFADGVDFSITGEDSGAVVLVEANVNANAIRSPVQAAHLNTDGSASAFTQNSIAIANERIKVVVAAGGAMKTGTITIIVA